MNTMTPQEILKKAIERAEWSGYHFTDAGSWEANYFPVIFDHQFARAFFGDGMYHCCQGSGCDYFNHGWQWHLPKMVLEENPITYLEQFL